MLELFDLVMQMSLLEENLGFAQKLPTPTVNNAGNAQAGQEGQPASQESPAVIKSRRAKFCPILVHCLDGYKRSCLFVVCFDLLQRLHNFRSVFLLTFRLSRIVRCTLRNCP